MFNSFHTWLYQGGKTINYEFELYPLKTIVGTL